MGLFDEVKGLATEYMGGEGAVGDAGAHFDQVSKTVDSSTVAQGIAAAMRSNQTAPFSQLATQMFSNGSPDQKASMLNTILAAAPQLSSLIPGLSGVATVTPQQASNIPTEAVQTIAHQAEQHDPSIVDKLSAVYANHPTLVKTLGAAVLAIAAKKMSERSAA